MNANKVVIYMPVPTTQKIALLLMAAGSSSRLGQPKQLVEVSQIENADEQLSQQSLLHRQVAMMDRICLSYGAKAYCVLGFESEVMIEHLASCPPAQHLTLIDNANWSDGLSGSIAKGVSALGCDIEAVLVFLVDQWQLTTSNLTSLITQWQQQPKHIHIACSDNNVSPPVIFPRVFFKELMALNGDDGARQVIKNNKAQVKSIEMPSAFFDLDTPEQLNDLSRLLNVN